MAIQTDDLPTSESFETGFAFEGIGDSRAAITNTGMYGPVWKALLNRAGFSYEQASNIALEQISTHEFPDLIDLDRLSADVEESVDWLVSPSLAGSASGTLALFQMAVAKKCVAELKQAAKLLKMAEPTEVAITGGWAENKAFVAAIKKCGLKVLIPPLAANATHAGLAANALVNVGDAENITEALQMLDAL